MWRRIFGLKFETPTNFESFESLESQRNHKKSLNELSQKYSTINDELDFEEKWQTVEDFTKRLQAEPLAKLPQNGNGSRKYSWDAGVAALDFSDFQTE